MVLFYKSRNSKTRISQISLPQTPIQLLPVRNRRMRRTNPQLQVRSSQSPRRKLTTTHLRLTMTTMKRKKRRSKKSNRRRLEPSRSDRRIVTTRTKRTKNRRRKGLAKSEDDHGRLCPSHVTSLLYPLCYWEDSLGSPSAIARKIYFRYPNEWYVAIDNIHTTSDHHEAGVVFSFRWAAYFKSWVRPQRSALMITPERHPREPMEIVS